MALLATNRKFKCELCEKTYCGRYASNNLRRHRQDKHNIPLYKQPKRNKWENIVRFKKRLYTLEELETILWSTASSMPSADQNRLISSKTLENERRIGIAKPSVKSQVLMGMAGRFDMTNRRA